VRYVRTVLVRNVRTNFEHHTLESWTTGQTGDVIVAKLGLEDEIEATEVSDAGRRLVVVID
jgi:hypothetical protein